MKRSMEETMFHQFLANEVDLFRQSGYTDQEILVAIVDKLQPLDDEKEDTATEYRD